MSDFKKGVFATAALCTVLSLLAYAEWFRHDAVWDAVVVGAIFLLFALYGLTCVAFALLTAASVALSLWFVLEWCCRKAWGLCRRLRRVRP